MGWVVIAFVITYFCIDVLCARRYFLRRHGVPISQGARGSFGAGLVGMFWPITIWLQSVRRPARCNHHRHILEHGRIWQELELVDQIKRRRDAWSQ